MTARWYVLRVNREIKGRCTLCDDRVMVCDDKGWCMLAEGWWVLCDDRWGMYVVWWLKDNVWWQLEDVCCMLIEGWWVLCDVRWMMCVVWWIYYIMAKGCVWWRRHGVCFVMAEGCWVLCHGRVVVYDDKGIWWCLMSEGWCVFCDDRGMLCIVWLQREDTETLAGYLSLHQSAEGLVIMWTPNQLMNGCCDESTDDTDRR